jgi:hypothetical protein
MGFSPPKGWDKESETLFIHSSGARIERRTYREKDGWFIIPADLDQEVVGYDPTPEGRDKAFTDFVEGKVKTTVKKTKKTAEPEGPPKPKRGRKPKERPEPVEGEGEGDEPGQEPAPAAAKDDEEASEKDEDEDEEKEEADEGDED